MRMDDYKEEKKMSQKSNDLDHFDERPIEGQEDFLQQAVIFFKKKD